jgi:hypothetical protein
LVGRGVEITTLLFFSGEIPLQVKTLAALFETGHHKALLEGAFELASPFFLWSALLYPRPSLGGEDFTFPLGDRIFASAAVGYKVGYNSALLAKEKGPALHASPCSFGSSGGRIRTSDLRVMSPTSYQAALPRDLSSS